MTPARPMHAHIMRPRAGVLGDRRVFLRVHPIREKTVRRLKFWDVARLACSNSGKLI